MAYRVEESSLTAVADAIREKAGSSEGLIFPEGFVSAVAGIQAGGGGNKLFVTEIIPETNIYNKQYIYLQHGLGAIPDFVVVQRKYSGSTSPASVNSAVLMCSMFHYEDGSTSRKYMAVCAIENSSSSVEVYDASGSLSSTMGYVTNCPAPAKYLEEKQIGITSAVNNSGVFLQSGVTYTVIAGLYS